jgi:DNA replication and repair protein RecF
VEIERFTARNFRNLAELDLRFGAGMNVVYGENAQGKTNLLEAVYLLSTLKSFRTRNLMEALQFGESLSVIHGSVRTGQSSHQLVVALERNGRIASLDHKKVDTLHYLGTFNVFLFSHPLLEVIRGGPEERRRFVDRSIAVSKPGYLPLLMQYHRALRQKNALLAALQRHEIGKTEGCNGIRAFNSQMVDRGLEILQQRVKYLELLKELVNGKKQMFFSDDVELGIEVNSSFLSGKEEIQKKMEESLEREITRGVSLIGVHRDEFRMTFNGKELRKYGSSGQHRAFLLLLVLAQIQLYERLRDDKPVLLLDDLDSELDEKKIRSFLDEVQDRYQTIISTSRRELFSRDRKIRMFEISAGNITGDLGVQENAYE